METIEIKVTNSSANFYLTELLKENGYNGLIPSNTIINKRRPAFGATHCELYAHRHSILIEPYITVIEVKKQKMGNMICAVMKDLKIDEIIAYLNDDAITYKKIITTPESFGKVTRALKKYDVNYRENFFLLIDECEKLIQHASFRNKIFGPMDDFFSFENKALISATPLVPSHPKFIEQGFKYLDLKPTFSYKKDIKIVATNNIRASLRNTIKLINLKKDGKPIFLFTNCKRSILYFTRLQGVKDDFKVFCAENLDVEFFKKNATPNVEFSVANQSYSKYNAFTSRFFAAVDMHPVGFAHIIILSNVPYVPHSAIDPYTEAIQICGRDRNQVKSPLTQNSTITHITNFYPKVLTGTDVDTIKELYFIERLQSLCEKTPNKLIKAFIKSEIDKELLSTALKEDGTFEPFLKDNYELNKSIKQLYYSKEALFKAYISSDFFNPKIVSVNHQFTDNDELIICITKNGAKRNRAYIEQLHELLANFETDNGEFMYHFHRLKQEDEFLFCAYKELGYDNLIKLECKKTKIKEAIFKLRQSDSSNHFLMIDKILSTFKPNVKIYVEDIEAKLQAIYEQFNHEKAPGVIRHAKGTDIERYFHCKRINGKEKIQGIYKSYYRLYFPLDKISEDLKYMAA